MGAKIEIYKKEGIKVIKAQWSKNFVLIIVISFFVYLTHIMILVVFPFYISELNGREWLAGLLQALFSIMSFAFRPLSGWMLDNGIRKKGLIIGVIGITLLPWGYIVVTALIIIVAMRILHGILHSLSSTTATTIAIDNIPKGRLSEGMGVVAMSTAVATCFAPTIAMYLRSRYGLYSVFLAAGSMSILALLLLLCLKAPEIQVEKKKLQAGNLVEIKAIPATVVFLTFLIAFGGMENFVAKYAAYKNNLPDATIYFAILAIAFLLTRVLLPKVTKCSGLSFFVYTGNISLLIALLLLAVMPNTMTFLISAFLAGYSLGGIQPALQTSAIQSSVISRRGVANSTFLCGFDAGMGLGAFVAGTLISSLGYEKMFGLIAIANIASMVVYAVSEKITMKKEEVL